jgi:hypothetical protein
MLNYSSLVYLNAHLYSPEAKTFSTKEELANGIKVDQKKLAELLILSGFIFLQNKGYLDFHLKEEGILFFKKQNPYATKLKDIDGDLSGLELFIMQNINDGKRVDRIVQDLLARDSFNPWADVTNNVKRDLIEKGLIKFEEKGKILFIKKYKAVEAKDLTPEDEVNRKEWEDAYQKFQSNTQLYERVQKLVSNGLNSMVTQDSSSDSSFD